MTTTSASGGPQRLLRTTPYAIGLRLRAARRDRGLTQMQVTQLWARVTGGAPPTQAFIAKCETARRGITPAEIAVFSTIYRLPADWIMAPRPLEDVPPPTDETAATLLPVRKRRPRGRRGTALPRGVAAARPLTDPVRRHALSEALRENEAAPLLGILPVDLWEADTSRTSAEGQHQVTALRAADLDLVDMLNAHGETPLYEAIWHARYDHARTLVIVGAHVLAKQRFTVVDTRPYRTANTAFALTPWELLIQRAQPARTDYRQLAPLPDRALGQLLVAAIRAIHLRWTRDEQPPGDLRIVHARRAIRAVVRSAAGPWNDASLHAAAVDARQMLETLHAAARSTAPTSEDVIMLPIR
jgi:hypothetical protein